MSTHDTGWWDTWGQDAAGIGATLGAGYLAYKGAGKAADATERAYEAAAEQTMPWNTGGLFGAATFDPTTRTSLQTLSPELQSEYDAYMSSAGVNRGQVAALGADPYAAGNKFYEQQKALYAPEQEKQRLGMENRLYAQGMFGSTGGGQQMNALLDAQQQQDAQNQIAGFDKAQALIDTYRGRQAADLGMVESLGLLPHKYASLGRGLGSDQSNIAKAGAAAQATAAQTMSDATSAFGTSFAGSINDRWGPKPT